MAKGVGTTKTFAPSKDKVKISYGSLADIAGASGLKEQLESLVKEYGQDVEIKINPAKTSAFAVHHINKDGKNEIEVYRSPDKQGRYYANADYPHNVGLNEESVTMRMKAIAAHEYAHRLTSGFGELPEHRIPWEKWKKDGQKNGLKVATLKEQYAKYIERKEKKWNDIPLKRQQFLRSLKEVEQDYSKNAKLSQGISGYAREQKRGEFIAEAFAYAKLYGKGKNQYADRVVSILDSYYKKKK